MSDKIQKLKELMSILNDSVGKEEFSKSFSALIDFVKKVDKDLRAKIDIKTQEAVERLEDTNQIYKKTIQKIEADNESTLSNVKKWALESVGKLFAKSKINEKLSDLDVALDRVSKLSLPETSVVALEASKMAQEELMPLIPKIVLEEEMPKLGKPIRDALELLQDDERLDQSAIKGLKEELEDLRKIITNKNTVVMGGGVGKQNVYYHDLSSSLDGVTKTFSMPAFARILDVKLSSAAVLRPTIDWTSDASALTITFTSQIDANPLLNSGQSLIVLYAI